MEPLWCISGDLAAAAAAPWFGSVCFSGNGACFYFTTHIYELIYFGTVPISTKRDCIKWSGTTRGQMSVFCD